MLPIGVLGLQDLATMKISNKLNGLREIWRFDNRWQLAFNRLLFPNEGIQIYRFKGVEVLVDHSAGDANGARSVLTSQMYRQYLPEMALGGRLNVLDIGANNGGFSLLMKSEGFDIGRLVAVELSPITFERLRFNLSRNFEGGFTALNCALTGENKTIRFSPSAAGCVSDNIYSGESNVPARWFEIEGRTFDKIYGAEFGNEHVDLCKIDIEGAEFEMAAHGKCGRLADCRYLLIEIHDEADRNRGLVLDVLFRLGFEEIGGERKRDELHHVHFLVNRKFG